MAYQDETKKEEKIVNSQKDFICELTEILTESISHYLWLNIISY